MCETLGDHPSRSILEWFLYFMNCYNMFFHVILDLKPNVSDTILTLATRIVWCCAHLWNIRAPSELFSFWVSFSMLSFKNCCNMFFHVILDLKPNVSDTILSLATRIVWCSKVKTQLHFCRFFRCSILISWRLSFHNKTNFFFIFLKFL